MADAPNCDARSDAPGAPSVDVVRPAELDGGANESGIEAPRKPRSEKQRAAFVKCREALAKKQETTKPKPPEPPPELPAIPEVAPKKPRAKRERRTIHIPDPEPEPEPEPPKPSKPPPKPRVPSAKAKPAPYTPPQPLFYVV